MFFQNGMNAAEVARRKAAAGGFTLIELLVVSAVLATLFGLAVGFLGRTDPKNVADSVLAGEIRSAQLTARAEGLPTEVFVRPGQDGASASVQSRLLQPVVTFHLEPGEGVLDESLRPTVGGEDVANGRFGHARRNREGDKAPILRWPVRPNVIDLREGLAIRLDLWLENRTACTVWRLGGLGELQLDDDLKPKARLRLTGGAAGNTPTVALAGKLALPLRRWCTIDVACDGRAAWITVDGRELDRAPAEGQPLHGEDDVFDVSPGDAAVPGLVDEVRMMAYVFGTAQTLPNLLQPDRVYRLAFDSRGQPIGSTAVKLLMPEERP
ncbi:MAG: prepilin-type N-terminal cleavage/methylation domain-containing protein [Planctomycetes bacterium]|nr:prepilin-type N-terminal cleavage/methylation domain-containing protein [Planctomycetota bacterium]